MPNSRVRRATEYEIVPYSPTAARIAASAPNASQGGHQPVRVNEIVDHQLHRRQPFDRKIAIGISPPLTTRT